MKTASRTDAYVSRFADLTKSSRADSCGVRANRQRRHLAKQCKAEHLATGTTPPKPPTRAERQQQLNDTTFCRTVKSTLTVDAANLEKLVQVSECSNVIWNILTERREAGTIHYSDCGVLLKQLRVEHPAFALPCSMTLQKVAEQHSANAASARTKRRNGDIHANPPGYRAKTRFMTQQYADGFVIDGQMLRLPYGSKPADWIEARINMPLPEYAMITAVSISGNADASELTVSLKIRQLRPTRKKPTAEAPAMYFDPGCKMALTGCRSDGLIVEYSLAEIRQHNMRMYKKLDVLMSYRDRLPCAIALAKFYKAKAATRRWLKQHPDQVPETIIWPTPPVMSNKYRELDAQITRGFALIKERTTHVLRKLAKIILASNPRVFEYFVGDWSPPETLADTGNALVNKRINRAVQNNNPVRGLIACLRSRAERFGRTVGDVGERGTTRTCANCLQVGPAVPLNQRIFRCGGAQSDATTSSTEATKKAGCHRRSTKAGKKIDAEQDSGRKSVGVQEEIVAADIRSGAVVQQWCGFQTERDVNSALLGIRKQRRVWWRDVSELIDATTSALTCYQYRVDPVTGAKRPSLKRLVFIRHPMSSAL